MTPSSSILRSALLVCALGVAQSAWSVAAESAYIVFKNGRSVPLTAVALQGDQLIVQTATESFSPGQSLAVASVDHVSGEKPAAINQAVALILTGKPREAAKLLEPVIAEHRITAKLPGNFWVEAARDLLVANALNGNAKVCSELGKEISDATPAPGTDPFVALGKALMLPVTVSVKERDAALRDLTIENMPADLSAYASFFRGKLFADDKKPAEALEAYLAVTCLYPSGSLVINAAAELNASEFLTTAEQRAETVTAERNEESVATLQREEAVAILQSAVRSAPGTVIAVEANKRLESLK